MMLSMQRFTTVPAILTALVLIALAASAAQAQYYSDVSESSGLFAVHVRNGTTTGSAIADFDRNGWPDVFVTGDGADNRLFLNTADGRFSVSPFNAQVALPGARCASASSADYDNDGWPDLYVACLQRNYLFRNDRGRGFVDVTAPSNTLYGNNTQAISWGDINNDGWLDLVLGQYSPNFPPQTPEETRDQLMFSDGDGTFTNLTHLLDAELAERQTLVLVLTDLDLDGDTDIYMGNDRHEGNVLWLNDGAGCGGWCLRDVSLATGTDRPADTMGVGVGDYDRDGDWDLFYSSSDEQVLLENRQAQGEFRFVERTEEAGVNVFTTGWGALFLDADNDGWQDAFLSGSGTTAPDHLMINQHNGQFAGRSEGLTETLWTYSAATLDYDRDGHLDLLLGHPGHGYRLYRNRGNTGQHWLVMRLEAGAAVNRDAIGTVVEVTTADGVTQMREIRAGESRGSNHQLIAHFGLGPYTSARVSLRWPDGLEQDLGELSADRYHYRVHPVVETIAALGFE